MKCQWAGIVLIGVIGGAAVGAACQVPALFTTVIEARRITADLRREFIQAADASNRAVVIAGETGADAAMDESAEGLARARQLVDRLRPLLVEGGLTKESAALDAFTTCLTEFETLDRQVLELAADGSNVRARRLAAGSGQEAADAFRDALDVAVRGLPSDVTPRAPLAVERARRALVEIQLLQLRHIPEPDDAAMTRLETDMTASARDLRAALADLRGLLPADRRASLDAAVAAIDRFAAIHADIITLSRRNSNVRSLALSMGRKRAVTLSCDESLASLDAALARHQFTGTR